MCMFGKKSSSILLVVVAIAAFVTVFELVKVLVFPGQDLWESHVITIVCFSLVSTAIAFVLLKKPYFATSRRVSRDARMTAHLGITGGSVAAGMTAYEVLKTLFFPAITIWQSHFVTIVFAIVISMFAAFFLLKRQRSYEEGLEREIEARRRTEHLLQMTLASIDEAVIATDDRGAVTILNRAAEAITGWSAEEAMGKVMSDIVTPEYEQRHPQSLSKTLSTGITEKRRGTYVLTSRGGTKRTVTDNASPILGAGDKVLGTVVTLRDVTEMERAMESLSRSEAALKAAQKLAHVGNWAWHVQEDRAEWSEEMCRIFGIEKTDLTGCVDERLPRFIHPDDLPAVTGIMRSIRRASAGEESFPPLECRVIRPDGSIRTVWAEADELVFDADGRPALLTGIIMDVTEYRRSEEALRESEQKFRAVFNQAPVGISLVDAKTGRFIQVNRKDCEILGRSEEELLGLDFRRITHPDDVNANIEAWKRMCAGEIDAYKAVKRYLRPDGSAVWVNITVVPIEYRKDPRGAHLALVEDLTERRKAEETRLYQQKRLLETERMATLGMLVAGVAHEVNNPNHAIALNAGVFAKVWDSITPILDGYYRDRGEFSVGGMSLEELKSEIPQCLQGIAVASKHIDSIVGGLRYFARDEADPEILETDFNLVVKAAVTLTANLVKKSTDAFHVSLHDGLPPVLGSFARLEQVVVNLIQNACEALTSRQAPIFVETDFHPRSGRILLTVKDGGAGMGPEVLSRVSDPFFTTKRNQGGMGLGVSLSKAIVASHGGELAFASERGKGTTVTVSLPAVVSQGGGRT